MTVYVPKGYCVINLADDGHQWVIVMEGNIWLPYRFECPEKALTYAARAYAKLPAHAEVATDGETS